MYKEIVYLNLFVTLSSFWIWRIIKEDLILAILLILLSFTFFSLIRFRYDKKIFIRRTFILNLLLFAVVSIKILTAGFDQNLRTLTPDQQNKLNERHGYLALELGKIFQNKFSLRFYKDVSPYLTVYESNIFNGLSINLYFFANHPRERGTGEFIKYFSPLTIPWLIGLLKIIKSTHWLIAINLFCALFITGFVKQTYSFGPILLFPIMNLLITVGLIEIFHSINKFVSKLIKK